MTTPPVDLRLEGSRSDVAHSTTDGFDVGTPPDPDPAASVVDSATRFLESFGPGEAVERCAWSLVWLVVLVGGLDLWGGWTAWPPAAWAAPLLVLAGVAGLTASWLVRSPRGLLYQISSMGSLLAGVLGHEAVGIHVRQYYTTDSGAFNQVAARLLAHGVNPYTASMAPAAHLLKPANQFWTYTVSGGYVTHVSYPAGSFLFEVPAALLGFHHEIVDWMDLFAWLATGVLLFALVPASIRWLAALVVVTPPFADIFSAGGTDAAFLPFMVLAVWRWDRYARGPNVGLARWMGPVALGLACSIKQTPWFCVPFLAIGIGLEARRSGRRVLRLVTGYLGIVLAVFAAVNLPFIVWSPTAWVRGTLLPFTDPLVVDGQGLVTLALHGVTGGVSLPYLTVAGLLGYLALLAAMVLFYPTMKRVWMLALPVVFFVASRSLATYLLDLFPAAIIAAVTVAPAARATGDRTSHPLDRIRWLVVALPAAAAVVVAVLAFTSPPLRVEVRSFVSSRAATSLDAVTVQVHNTTDSTVTPHFSVNVGTAHPDGFWLTADHRPVVLGPGSSATVTLYPSNYASAPGHGSYWLVEAYTTSPEALSTSPLQLWRLGKPS